MRQIVYELNNMQYVVRHPENYTENEAYPAILFLHGSGTRGHDVNCVLNHFFLQLTEKMTNFPFVVFFPLCSEDTWFDAMENLRLLVREMTQLSRIDSCRIYLTGVSMGGYAAWQLAMSMPEYFAAVAPVCGGGMYWNAERLKHVPVWAFHGAKDETVFPEESEKMVNAVNNAGGHAKLTLYAEKAHDIWTDIYSDPALYTWFLSHQNNRILLSSKKEV